MQLHQVAYALAVAEEQSFTRAADRLHLAQPSLSRQVRLLEHELGVVLFNRGPGQGRVTLTPDGNVLVPFMRRVLADVDATGAEARALSGMARGHVGIGATPSLVTSVLAPRHARQRPRLGPRGVDVGQDAPHEGHQHVPVGRQRDATLARAAVEEDHAELVLEQPDLTRERRLGQMQPGGGPGEALLLGDGQGVGQLVQLHAVSESIALIFMLFMSLTCATEARRVTPQRRGNLPRRTRTPDDSAAPAAEPELCHRRVEH